MGQFRAVVCPICGGPPVTNWTCAPCTELVTVHRGLIRNLQHWRSLYEAMEVTDTLVAADGQDYALWDVYLFYEGRTVCSDRMRQSIEFCLFDNLKEEDAALRMGIKPSNPVSVYATIGLTTMLTRAAEGSLPGGYTVSLDRGLAHV